jgi:hypothetical protein
MSLEIFTVGLAATSRPGWGLMSAVAALVLPFGM